MRNTCISVYWFQESLKVDPNLIVNTLVPEPEESSPSHMEEDVESSEPSLQTEDNAPRYEF